jgi:hypothetical protein
MSRPNRVPRDLGRRCRRPRCPRRDRAGPGPLAASPLDEQATTRMKAALERAESPAVRRAIRRLARPGEPRPPLQAVPPMTTDRTAGARPQAPPAVRRSCQFMTPMLAPGGAA